MIHVFRFILCLIISFLFMLVYFLAYLLGLLPKEIETPDPFLFKIWSWIEPSSYKPAR